MKVKMLYDNEVINDSLTEHPIIKKLINHDLKSLDRQKFIIFPQHINESNDLKEDNMIFQSRNGKIWTCNVVGIFSGSKDELRINSRFSNRTINEDYFLRYMLQKVLNYNVIEDSISSSEKMSYYNMLIFLFPYYLEEAMRKGVYKEYVKRQYNNTNISGTIDVARHVRSNIPFIGNVAYRTREFSYDNKLTQLVRHTIEKIQNEYQYILNNNDSIKKYVSLIKQTTTTYSKLKRFEVLQSNIMHPIRHSYYAEYAALQRLCIQILSEEKSGFDSDHQQIHGIIIDISWLWEEYIGKVTGWKHYGRNKELATINLFQNSRRSPRYPDFSVGNLPIDTKYKKNLDTRNDYNQMTTYIHIMNKEKKGKIRGGFIQPTSDVNPEKHGYKKLGILCGFGGEMFTYKFFIPQEASSYSEFLNRIRIVEEELKKEFI
ncbi:guanosine 5'-monophosphate oxidoreductase [Enterococcus casseliflavus]|nr:guanosine 5'-monophosphate oxidoreductase [Enterococcus casseliflavus]MBO6349461.1 guanosine 5'-monophosphate oxidoreductase [Enterococcus casseliflavus]MBO6358658.1 guanosine 5'-monophosphate oxidoreductase [Enterococcus casseliflavus]MBO6367186.1 guanosine 5'-monophosphate oxidoreductase [Enterococcus casseliflavus]MBO6375934.1 guanosine 5'-monophosphate oxidoreductase [Enterococcus casseliflavus]NKD28631.1 guanosine 5'-monophosphate oxidoreductase [Enterococcus casseliflavus]